MLGKRRKGSTVPQLINKDGQQVSEQKDKAEALVKKLFPNQSTSDATLDHNPLCFTKITEDKIGKIIRSIPDGKSPGSDGIPSRGIKVLFQVYPQIILQILNASLYLGKLPECWKLSTGAVIRKARKPNYSDPKAYRVICLIPIISQHLEKVVTSRLYRIPDLIHNTQFGFRPEHSTEQAMIFLLEEIHGNWTQNKHTAAAFMDVEAAFDNMDHNTLIRTVEFGGVPTYLNTWIFSFLSNRKLQLRFDGKTSIPHNNNSGAPQGSPLSPFLFAAYVTPFLRELYANGHGNNITYADDLVLTGAEHGLKDSVETLQQHVNCALALAEKHNIKFGILKPEMMVWKRNQAREEEELKIIIEEKEFHPQNKLRWLGYHLQSDKLWNHHVRMRKAATMGIINLFNQKCTSLGYRGAPPSAALTNLKTTILPVLTYGMGIWWTQQKTLVDDLQKTLNQAMRATSTAPITTPITSM